ELKVETEPLKTSNIALGRQVYGAGAVPPNLPKNLLTDGLVSTYSHPDPAANVKAFYFTVDLGRTLPLDHIVIRGRGEGSDADRLRRYRVEILASTSPNRRKIQWQKSMHDDGSRVPIAGSDVIRAGNGEGKFSGDSVRIWNESGDI